MKILVLGAGAVGGYFGGRLLQAEQQVSFLVREPRKANLDAFGLRIRSQFGNYQTPVHALTSVPPDGAWDLVIVTCKAYDLPSAIESIRPAVGPHTAVLPLLNGLSHLEPLNQAFGPSRVLGGLAKIVARLGTDGAIEHMNDWCGITFGEQNGQMSARVTALAAAFPSHSVNAKAVPNVMQAMWEKIVHLSTVAVMACLMRANVGEIAATPGGTEKFIEVLETNAAIAASEGYGPPESFLAGYRQLFADRSSTYGPSILRDLEAGKLIEGEHVVGFMVKKARLHGIAAPVHELAYLHLQAYEQRRMTGRL